MAKTAQPATSRYSINQWRLLLLAAAYIITVVEVALQALIGISILSTPPGAVLAAVTYIAVAYVMMYPVFH